MTIQRMPSTVGTVCPRNLGRCGCNISWHVQRTSGEKASAPDRHQLHDY